MASGGICTSSCVAIRFAACLFVLFPPSFQNYVSSFVISPSASSTTSTRSRGRSRRIAAAAATTSSQIIFPSSSPFSTTATIDALFSSYYDQNNDVGNYDDQEYECYTQQYYSDQEQQQQQYYSEGQQQYQQYQQQPYQQDQQFYDQSQNDGMMYSDDPYQHEQQQLQEQNQGLILDGLAQEMNQMKSKYGFTESDYLAAARRRAEERVESINSMSNDEDWFKIAEEKKQEQGDIDDWENALKEAGNSDSQILMFTDPSPGGEDGEGGEEEPKLLLF